MPKQISHQNKILFFELFTKELILNSGQKLELTEIREAKKEKIEEKEEKQELVEKEITKPIVEEEKLKPVVEKPGLAVKEITKPIEPERFIPSITTPKLSSFLQKPTTIKPSVAISPIAPQKIKPKFTIPVSKQPIEGEIDLGKLNIFLPDKAVTEIECPSPGKFIIVKKAGQINLTKITLLQAEINRIIENFSKKARIPVIGGVFRASVGNLTITAIISEFVGSRFIIYKASAYSLIDQQTQRLQQAQLQAQLQYRKHPSFLKKL